MSPIVYVPLKKHECEPPKKGDVYSSGYEGVYPEGTIWECDECARRWELRYEFSMGRTRAEHEKGISYDEANWRRA